MRHKTRKPWIFYNPLTKTFRRRGWVSKGAINTLDIYGEKERLLKRVFADVRNVLRGQSRSRALERLVGYSAQEVRKHFKSHFMPGMHWGNYGSGGWEIHHVIPVSSFKFSSPEDAEFRMCWRLDNLRPLWALDHSRRSDRILRSA
jgi:hypothetical protein